MFISSSERDLGGFNKLLVVLDVVIDMDYGKGLVDSVLAGFPVSVEGTFRRASCSAKDPNSEVSEHTRL